MMYIVRHGETEWNKKKIIQGSVNDEPLNSIGRKQAQKLANYFSKKNLDIIISSPLRRAKETALTVAIKKDIDVIYDKGFTEIDYGDWSGKESSEIPKLYPKDWEGFTKDPDSFKFRNGESFKLFYKRVIGSFEKIDKNKTVLLVTHTNPIRMIISYVLNTTILNAYKLHFGNCTVNKLVFRHNRWEVDFLNCRIT